MYIVNEKIPERCLDCHFYTWKDGYCYLLREDAIPVAEASHSRAASCPLIEGDIDASVVVAKVAPTIDAKPVQHDRLMKSLIEIKEICKKSENENTGCGDSCPFLMHENETGFRDCEILQFLRDDYYTPKEWGEAEAESEADDWDDLSLEDWTRGEEYRWQD